jgi:hypothetical protein
MSQLLEQQYLAASQRLAQVMQAYQQAIDAVETARPPHARNRWQTKPELHQAFVAATWRKQEAEQTCQAAWQALINAWRRRVSVIVLTDCLPYRSGGYDIVADRQYLGKRVLPGKARVVGHPSGIVLIQVQPVPMGNAWLVVGDKLKAIHHAEVIYADSGCGAILQVWQDGRWQEEDGQVRTVRRLGRERAA